MELTFTKMHGAGNDFVVIDSRELNLYRHFDMFELARTLCDRRFGIGADQLLLLCSSNEADFKMVIFNADGGEVEMCGNGIRCLARYIWDRELSNKDVLEIETLAGIMRPERAGKLVKVDMGEPVLDEEKGIDYPLQISDHMFKLTCVSMGNPHAVIFLDEDISAFPVSVYGPVIESHPLFPNKTNVEFVNVLNSKELRMRVWERGTGETMACGTGASASVVAAILKRLTERNVTLHLRGGDLEVKWPVNGHVYMTGPAAEVFEGRITNLSERRAEQRRHPRKMCQTPLDFRRKGEAKGTVHRGICLDISEGGVGMETEIELKPGELLSFLKKDGQSILKSAVVIWSTNYEKKCKSGLMFI